MVLRMCTWNLPQVMHMGQCPQGSAAETLLGACILPAVAAEKCRFRLLPFRPLWAFQAPHLLFRAVTLLGFGFLGALKGPSCHAFLTSQAGRAAGLERRERTPEDRARAGPQNSAPSSGRPRPVRAPGEAGDEPQAFTRSRAPLRALASVPPALDCGTCLLRGSWGP